MNALTLSFDGLISLLGGIYCSLIAFRFISPGKDPERVELWYKKFGTMMKFIGPLLILFGLLKLLGVIK